MTAVTRSLHGQLARFLIVGACTVGLDFLVYRLLLLLDAPIVPSKAASFIVATALAYVLNRRWTFRAHGDHHTALAFATLYASTLVVNVVVNSLALRLLGATPGHVELAFLAAQAVSTTLNFLAMRYVIFTRTVPSSNRR